MKPRNRQEWRVLLDLLRMIRTATNEERAEMLKYLVQARQKEGA